MSAVVHSVDMTSFEAVVDGNEIVVLDFWAEWCKPCKILGPVFEALAEQNPDIYFGKVNVDAAKELAQAFQVRSVPTLMAFKKGSLVFEQPGLPSPAQLEDLLGTLRALEPPPEEPPQDP